MTIKSKDTIFEKSKIVFNKMEIYTSKKMKYSHPDNMRDDQLLISYSEEKSII